MDGDPVLGPSAGRRVMRPPHAVAGTGLRAARRPRQRPPLVEIVLCQRGNADGGVGAAGQGSAGSGWGWGRSVVLFAGPTVLHCAAAKDDGSANNDSSADDGGSANNDCGSANNDCSADDDSFADDDSSIDGADVAAARSSW